MGVSMLFQKSPPKEMDELERVLPAPIPSPQHSKKKKRKKKESGGDKRETGMAP